MTFDAKTNLWQDFSNQNNLTNNQLYMFKKYFELLEQWNKDINLTRIVDLQDVIHYHFEDSLVVSKFVDFNQLNSICDVGTGAGFPGLPLKIIFPHLNLVLIEVNEKKRLFLQTVIKELALINVEIYAFDWRTFLRTSSYSINLFCARASLHTDELLRMLKLGSFYKDSQLVYWASINWEPSKNDLVYLKRKEEYVVGDKKRKLIFFSR